MLSGSVNVYQKTLHFHKFNDTTPHSSCKFWNAVNISVSFLTVSFYQNSSKMLENNPILLPVCSFNLYSWVNVGIINETEMRHRITSFYFPVESLTFLLKRYIQYLCDFSVQLWYWGCLPLMNLIHINKNFNSTVIQFAREIILQYTWWGYRYVSSSIFVNTYGDKKWKFRKIL